MYAALWRVLPGNVALRVLQLVALGLVVVTLLMLWVFPYIAQFLAVEQSTLN